MTEDANAAPERTISLALVSHTNAGKTTLARTLLGREIGEVRDAPHVTEFSDAHVLVETADGERLTLWDTPGFGDSVRLARRLRQHANPIARFLAEVWDRWRDRPLWASQQALRTVRDEADVLLYLVNAAEPVGSAGYVRPEMEILTWLGKPVIVLLNQLDRAASGQADAAERARWRASLAETAIVRVVLPLDAFARCWVQELVLFAAIEAALPEARRPLMARLTATRRRRLLETFDASVHALALSLARLATMTETLPEPAGVGDRLRSAVAALGSKGKGDGTPAGQAAKSLARRVESEARTSTRELVALHGLTGEAEGEIAGRLAEHVDVRLRVDEASAALWGGAVTGALSGLSADVLSGGLTLGGGMIAGGLLGALGGAGVARGMNVVRGTGQSSVAWNAEAFDAMLEAALLRYLAVAHFGRGRGDWRRDEAAPHWRGIVAAALAGQRDELALVWSERPQAVGGASELDVTTSAAALEPIVRAACKRVLAELYPEASALVA